MPDGQWGPHEPLCVCLSRPELSSAAGRLCGWEPRPLSEGDAGCVPSTHCQASHSPSPHPSLSPSDTSLHHGKNSTASVARTDSRSSLRSLGYEVPKIRSSFSPSEGTDLAREASEHYRRIHTYPFLEKRVRKDSGLGTGPPSASRVLPGPTPPVPAARVKPKLLVFGETRPFMCTYAKPTLHKKRQVGAGGRGDCVVNVLYIQLLCCLGLQIELLILPVYYIVPSVLLLIL